MKTLHRWALNLFVCLAITFGGCLIGALAIVARIMDRFDRRGAPCTRNY